MDTDPLNRSEEEIDLLQRSVKKFKRRIEGELASPIANTTMESDGWAGLFRHVGVPPGLYTGSDVVDDRMMNFWKPLMR